MKLAHSLYDKEEIKAQLSHESMWEDEQIFLNKIGYAFNLMLVRLILLCNKILKRLLEWEKLEKLISCF